jgi:hypothetical protein
MPHGSKADTDELIGRAKSGDFQARQQLLVRHRDRLRRMIAVRMDRRLAARVDPSDVVQDVLTDAAQELSEYQLANSIPTPDAALNAVLAKWTPTDSSAAAALPIDPHPFVGLSSRAGPHDLDSPDEFWASIAASTLTDKSAIA